MKAFTEYVPPSSISSQAFSVDGSQSEMSWAICVVKFLDRYLTAQQDKNRLNT